MAQQDPALDFSQIEHVTPGSLVTLIERYLSSGSTLPILIETPPPSWKIYRLSFTIAHHHHSYPLLHPLLSLLTLHLDQVVLAECSPHARDSFQVHIYVIDRPPIE